MKIIRIIILVIFVVLVTSCSYHSNTYPAELKNPKILTEEFQVGSKSISIRNDEIVFPNWSILFFGKRILPKLNGKQKVYVNELERLRLIRKQQLKLEKLNAKGEAKRERLEKKIAKINNFPNEIKSGKSNYFLWFFTHDYKKVGYEYVYSEKTLFWDLIKWGKQR